MKDDVLQTTALLEHVSAVSKNFEEQYRKTGMKYNIFNVAGIKHKEVIVCRVIADLLNPKGLHYRGDAYLRLFMDMVVKPHIEQARRLDISRANVMTEYPIPGNNGDRRIDIVIDDGAVFIPIEVKIYAGDQEKQVADYAAFSKKKNTTGFIPVLFLTLDGHKPSDAEAGDFVCVSFAEHIIPWLKKCLNLDATDNAAPVREILKQFMRAIKLLCNYMEDEEMENEINSLIMQSEDSYLAALRIKQALEGELDFNEKACKVFKETIFKLVKAKISGAKWVPDVGGWWYIKIPIRNQYNLNINYDWKAIQLEITGTPSDNEKSAIGQFMFNETRCSDEKREDSVWVSENTKFPGLENTDDSIYLLRLYNVYSKDPQSAADKIIALVKGLEDLG